MDISFNVEKIAEAFRGKRREDLEAVIGKAFIDCLEKGHLYFRGSMDVNATEYMVQQIRNFTAVSVTADTEEDKPRRKPGRKPGRKPKNAEPEKPAWTTEGKTHEQMLKEKMAMHNDFELTGAPKKRSGRKPKNPEAV